MKWSDLAPSVNQQNYSLLSVATALQMADNELALGVAHLGYLAGSGEAQRGAQLFRNELDRRRGLQASHALDIGVRTLCVSEWTLAVAVITGLLALLALGVAILSLRQGAPSGAAATTRLLPSTRHHDSDAELDGELHGLPIERGYTRFGLELVCAAAG